MADRAHAQGLKRGPRNDCLGKAHHESRLADLDGDGLLDIVGKPYSFGAPIVYLWLQRREGR